MGPGRRDLPARGDARRCWKETEEALEAPQRGMGPRGETVEKEEEDEWEGMLGLGRAPAVGGGGGGDADAMSRAG